MPAPAFAQTGVYKVKPSSSSSSQSSPLVCTYIAQITSAQSVIFFIMIIIIPTRLCLHCTQRTASYPSPPGMLLLQMRWLWCSEVVSRTQKLFSIFSWVWIISIFWSEHKLKVFVSWAGWIFGIIGLVRVAKLGAGNGDTNILLFSKISF